MLLRGERRVGLLIVVLLLRAGIDGDAALPQGDALRQDSVTSSQEGVSYTLSEGHLNGSGPRRLGVAAGQKLQITIQHLSGDPVCTWSRGGDSIHALSESGANYSMVIPLISESDSGDYTFSCTRGNSINSSLTVSLLVGPALGLRGRPTKPQLKYISAKYGYLPKFRCDSEGDPSPNIQWFHKLDKSEKGNDEHMVESKEYCKTTAMCCASNIRGEECTQLYDYDLDGGSMYDDGAPEVTLSSGQSLLLRCKIYEDKMEWLRDSDGQVVIQRFSYNGLSMSYLYVDSVNVNHSGIYTCRRDSKKNKSTRITVLEREFLTIHQLNESSTISAQDRPSFCLRAVVSSHPPLRCHWVGPDGTQTQCPEPKRRGGNRPVELCKGSLDPGEYQLHLQAGKMNITRTLSLCVAGTPTFNVTQGTDNITCETRSPLPLNLTWRSCPLFNDSCQSESAVWQEIPAPPPQLSDSAQFCHKTVLRSLKSASVEDHLVKCCLSTSISSHCSQVFAVSGGPKSLRITEPSHHTSYMLKVSSFVLVLALVLVSVALLYFIRKKKPQYQSQLQMIQMVGPNDNDYIYINFKDFQYDQKWEFPRENLELGKELGSGAFGMVVQATAYGISKTGVSQQVAVKMLKEKHQTVEKEALVSELKMLTHIGHHPNIVNLLGACTGSGPTYLIFQYCCNGDLLNYLKNNREHYHKSLTDAFTRERFSCLYHNLRPKTSSSEFQRPDDNSYVTMFPATTRGQENLALLSLNSSPMDTSEGPGIYEELVDLQEEELQTLTYDDLLSFAYQVAMGMDFLSSKNCLHRDLAARNVLVTQGRLVKIGDFGLARDIDNDSNYVVRGNVRLPVKWMAPESIFQGMYTMQSDVWAYGILLWEIFSLGVTPYPGIKVDSNFYVMIERGYKMEQPYYANESLYGIICKCWALEPHDRPHFSKLAAFMDNQLAELEQKVYHKALDQNSNDSLYQNAPVNPDISALAKEKEGLQTQTQNQYCKTHATE